MRRKIPVPEAADAAPATARADLDRRRAYLNLKLTESAVDFFTTLGLLDPRDLQADLDGFGFYPALVPPYYRQSQKRGEVLPVYTTTQQLRLIRDRSRKLCAENPFAICAVENRRSYVVGEGLTYRAVPRKKECPPALVGKCQAVIDGFVEANELGEVESDCMARYDADGEWFLRFFPQETGLMLVRQVEPELVWEPAASGGGSFDPRHSFGIETDRYDVEKVAGYWIVEDPITQGQTRPSYVPARDVLHVRGNVHRTAKRGCPTFYPVEANLRRADDLLASMTSMAKTRAKIALIKKFNGVLASTAQALQNSLTDATITDPTINTTVNLEKLRWGSILYASDNINYEFPSADVQASDFVAVLQAELRSIAARLNMPEWMLTADASNANYSSSLVAEAPSTKTFQRLQKTFARAFGASRVKGKESAVWRQLKHAIRLGVLPRETLFLIDVQVEGPSLVVRDQGSEAQMNKTYYDMRLKSRQTIQQELGLDADTEAANLAADKLPPAAPAKPGQGETGPAEQPQPQPNPGEKRGRGLGEGKKSR